MSSAKCDTCDGKNVVVLGSEFSMRPEEPIQKTQQASRHMLLQSLLA
ncbi:jg25075, partial [Pararge aegeria aegeria]